MIDDRACFYGIGVGRDRNGDAVGDDVEVDRDSDGELGLSDMGI